jgi:hypothetical protein
VSEKRVIGVHNARVSKWRVRLPGLPGDRFKSVKKVKRYLEIVNGLCPGVFCVNEKLVLVQQLI